MKSFPEIKLAWKQKNGKWTNKNKNVRVFQKAVIHEKIPEKNLSKNYEKSRERINRDSVILSQNKIFQELNVKKAYIIGRRKGSFFVSEKLRWGGMNNHTQALVFYIIVKFFFFLGCERHLIWMNFGRWAQ